MTTLEQDANGATLAVAVADFDEWRDAARALLEDSVEPERVHWRADLQQSLFDSSTRVAKTGAHAIHVPASVIGLLEDASSHRDVARFSLMYRVLWRVMHGERHLLDDVTDEDVTALTHMQREVRRDAHKMTAFVRFNPVPETDGTDPRWFAWYEPIHHVLHRVAPHFVRRFATMHWAIATPDGIAIWDRAALRFLPPTTRPMRAAHDDTEALWLAYYRSIFNPARLNVRAMQREMPQQYWANLPEARAIPELVLEAPKRVASMLEDAPKRAAGKLEDAQERGRPQLRGRSIQVRDIPVRPVSRASATPATCRRCPLFERATQAVSGKGPEHADVMIVGEQPGDEEDLRGEPFVGPAGQVLRRALREIDADIERIYVTNAVKHFSWEPRGKRRIHKTPAQREIDACRTWLDDEIARVRPRVLVALGATAAYSVLERKVAISRAREQRTLQHACGTSVRITYHPAAILRAVDTRAQQALYATFVADLRRAFEEAQAGAREARNSLTARTNASTFSSGGK
jgi:DNA polymerase